MRIPNIDHPDIKEYIASKSKPGKLRLRRFNVSVALIYNSFAHLFKRVTFSSIDPRPKKICA